MGYPRPLDRSYEGCLLMKAVLPRPSLLGSAWRYRRMSAAIVVASVAVAGLLALLGDRRTTATASVELITPTGNDQVGVAASGTEPSFVRYVKQRAVVMTSDTVL